MFYHAVLVKSSMRSVDIFCYASTVLKPKYIRLFCEFYNDPSVWGRDPTSDEGTRQEEEREHDKLGRCFALPSTTFGYTKTKTDVHISKPFGFVEHLRGFLACCKFQDSNDFGKLTASGNRAY